ncbi:MAG: PIN domain-containing protein, partial [Chloroflexota bacterium]
MLDTNACIGGINGRPPSARERLTQLAPTDVAISQIVGYELEFGVCHSRNQKRNRADLLPALRYVQVLDWSAPQSVVAAEVRCELDTRVGQAIGTYDTHIVAHA